ncbi:hypothetical protein SAMN06295987_1241 [Novosphingobium mathurense]|uniref:Uncharacterized protein n=2 Tax=Novosphingobium mathurense TaxID=428990 RepID=A0A1U6IYD6_9SPHN|nr:hypothetical protein SAMN06295987_1241 [Novosphingobium mathurense]
MRVGMTKAEVKALYPKRLVPLSEGCHAVVSTEYGTKGLTRVNLEWSIRDDSTKKCGEMVTNTLLEKYGEPSASEREIKENDCGSQYASGLAGKLAALCKSMGGEGPEYFQYHRWLIDGIEITIKVDAKADDPHWWAVYRPIEGTSSTEAAAKL